MTPWRLRGLSVGLFLLGLFTRFALLGYPRQVVFDEYHFGKFVNGYLRGEFFFDIHPPLGRLLLALSAYLGGYDGSQPWAKIGEEIGSDVPIAWLRAPSALQGAALLPLLFATGRAAGLSVPAALLAPLCVLFDICFLVESRLVLTDATLLLGLCLQLYGSFSSDAFPALSRGWLKSTAIAGIGITLAVCTKWTGTSAVAVAGLHSLLSLTRTFTGSRVNGRTAAFRAVGGEAVVRVGLLLLLPLLVYVCCFALHFWLLPKTGRGVSFMTREFRATLEGDEALDPTSPLAADLAALPDFWGKFYELNARMLSANAKLKREHSWGSRWYEWPLMMRSVLFWVGKAEPYKLPATGQTFARIYCIGSPAVWWLAAAAPTVFVARALSRLMGILSPLPPDPTTSDPDASDPGDGSEATGYDPEGGAVARRRFVNGCLLLAGYVINWLPFVMVDRVAFLYHFLPALLFALLLLGVVFDSVVPSTPLLGDRDLGDDDPSAATTTTAAAAFLPPLREIQTHPDALRWLLVGLIVYVLAAIFAFFSPLAYGNPMTFENLNARLWLRSWE